MLESDCLTATSSLSSVCLACRAAAAADAADEDEVMCPTLSDIDETEFLMSRRCL